MNQVSLKTDPRDTPADIATRQEVSALAKQAIVAKQKGDKETLAKLLEEIAQKTHLSHQPIQLNKAGEAFAYVKAASLTADPKKKKELEAKANAAKQIALSKIQPANQV